MVDRVRAVADLIGHMDIEETRETAVIVLQNLSVDEICSVLAVVLDAADAVELADQLTECGPFREGDA